MKRIQLLLLTLLLAFPLAGVAQQAQRGDVDGDGKVGIDDVTAIIDLLLNGSAAPASGDVDGDGKVGIDDVTALIDLLLNGGSAPVDGDWVDLGLPSGTIWATRNVGANSPEDSGDYFAWGETVTKNAYSWSSYQWCDGSYNKLTKYCANSRYGKDGFVDNLTELDLEDDAAAVLYPGGRMPSAEQIQELIDHCTCQWTQQGGVDGELFTGPNGNTMFLPAAGYYWTNSVSEADSGGCYWSRSLNTGGTVYSHYLYFNSSECMSDYINRCYGHTIRAVRAN